MQEDASLKQVDYDKETCTILATPWNTLKGNDVNKKRMSLLAIINATKLSLVKPISFYASREYKKVKYFMIHVTNSENIDEIVQLLCNIDIEYEVKKDKKEVAHLQPWNNIKVLSTPEDKLVCLLV